MSTDDKTKTDPPKVAAYELVIMLKEELAQHGWAITHEYAGPENQKHDAYYIERIIGPFASDTEAVITILKELGLLNK